MYLNCVFDGCLVHFTPSLHFTSGLDGAGPSMEPRDSGDSPEAWMGFGRGILPSRHASPGASPCGGHVFFKFLDQSMTAKEMKVMKVEQFDMERADG